MQPANYINRNINNTLDRLVQGFPVIGITGPRQSGKTTLARHYFNDKPYLSLENPDTLNFAQSDPKGLLNQYPQGVIIDEVQRHPQLLSYIQGIVDESRVLPQFILTGSQQFNLRSHISQSLAGRIAMVELLPLSINELSQNNVAIETLAQQTIKGFYPPIYDRNISPYDWYGSYIQTYVERDVKYLLNIKDDNLFRNFLKLLAGRSGQLMNLSSLGNDCSISYNTVSEWLSILNSSYITFKLQPHYRNFSKRLVKSPKYYFYDSGLLCWLLGIKEQEHLLTHPLRGSIFENFIVAELCKYFHNSGQQPPLYFWRDKTGLEIDVILEKRDQLFPIEIKLGQTITNDYFKNINKWRSLSGNDSMRPTLIYAGKENQLRTHESIYSWLNLSQFLEKID